MAERKAVNKYYPPDWDPSKGSINQYGNSHSLRARAKKIHEGILVVRFEMPFNIWCLGCDNHISMGVRYNAEKRKIGNYYTSPIYQFKMKCHLCETYFIIQTEPGKFDYVVLSGARRQVRSDIEKDSVNLAQVSRDCEEESKKMTVDAMFRLEKRIEDKRKLEEQLPTLEDLKKWKSRWADSFSINQLARSQFRKRRKQIEQKDERDKKLLNKASLDISLVTPHTCDRREAMKIMARSKQATNSETPKKFKILNAEKIISNRAKNSDYGSQSRN